MLTEFLVEGVLRAIINIDIVLITLLILFSIMLKIKPFRVTIYKWLQKD